MKKGLKRKIRTFWYGRLLMSAGIFGVLVFSTLQLWTVWKHRPQGPSWVLDLSQSMTSLTDESISRERKNEELLTIHQISQVYKLPITRLLVLNQAWQQELEQEQKEGHKLRQALKQTQELKKSLELERELSLQYLLKLQKQIEFQQEQVLTQENLLKQKQTLKYQQTLAHELKQAKAEQRTLGKHLALYENLLENALIQRRIQEQEDRLALSKALQQTIPEKSLEVQLSLAKSLENARERERVLELERQIQWELQLTQALKQRLRLKLTRALKETQALSQAIEAKHARSQSLQQEQKWIRLLVLEQEQALALTLKSENEGALELLQTINQAYELTNKLASAALLGSVTNMELEQTYRLSLYQESVVERLSISEPNRARILMQSATFLATSLLILLGFSIMMTKLQGLPNVPRTAHLIVCLPEEYIAELKALHNRLQKTKSLSTWTIRQQVAHELAFLLWTYYTQVLIENIFLPPGDQTIDD